MNSFSVQFVDLVCNKNSGFDEKSMLFHLFHSCSDGIGFSKTYLRIAFRVW